MGARTSRHQINPNTPLAPGVFLELFLVSRYVPTKSETGRVLTRLSQTNAGGLPCDSNHL